MTGFVALDAEERITTIYWGQGQGPNHIEVEFPEDFDLENEIIHNYRVEGGALVYDPLPDPEPVPTPLEALETENRLLKARVQVLDARSDFLEDCIAEMAMQVYQ